MKAIIHQHDWSVIEDWFEKRAKVAGVSKYSHTETVSTTPVITPEFALAMSSMARRAGESISDLVLSFNE